MLPELLGDSRADIVDDPFLVVGGPDMADRLIPDRRSALAPAEGSSRCRRLFATCSCSCTTASRLTSTGAHHAPPTERRARLTTIALIGAMDPDGPHGQAGDRLKSGHAGSAAVTKGPRGLTIPLPNTPLPKDILDTGAGLPHAPRVCNRK